MMPKRVGRPAKGPYVDKRTTISTRVTRDLRHRLEEACGRSGRSLSQEIEIRLDRSMLQEEALSVALGGRGAMAMARLLAAAVTGAEAATGQGWPADSRTFAISEAAIAKMLALLRPDSESPAELSVEALVQLGNAVADQVLDTARQAVSRP